MLLMTCHATATTKGYTLSLHDALPISRRAARGAPPAPSEHHAEGKEGRVRRGQVGAGEEGARRTRPSFPSRSEEHTSELSHPSISYAVFCLKKKKNNRFVT